MNARPEEFVAKIIIIVALLYMPYYLTASSFFHEERTTQVRCPITMAATVATKFDGTDDIERRRYIAVQCNYAAAGVPEPKAHFNIDRDIIYSENGKFHRFSEVANKRKNITEGDTFACTAVWTAYKKLPLARTHRGDTVLTNCRVATRS